MAEIRATTLIRAPPEVVWDVISDVECYPELSAAFTDEVTYVSDDPIREGTVYREVGGLGPISVEEEWHVVTFEPPTRQVHESEFGPMRLSIVLELNPVGEDTRLRQAFDYDLLPQFRPLGRVLEDLVVTPLMKRGLRDTVANAKRMSEARYADDSKSVAP